MNTTTQKTGLDYSGKFNETTTTGAGRGMASLGDAMTAAGITTTTTTTGAGAGRLLGIDATSIADALGGRELAAGSLLAECQQQQDRRIVERSAYKLRARMQGDGKTVELSSFEAAIQDAFCAVVMWRAGGVMVRDANGCDTLGAGELEKHVARVAWRALVASLSTDSVGESIQIMGGQEDDWLFAQILPSESRAERKARWAIEARAGSRQMELVQKMADIGAGRGRRKAAVEKVGNALGLMLGGDTLDQAAAAVGFKVRGRHAAGDSLLRAAKRLGIIGEGFTIPRRGR